MAEALKRLLKRLSDDVDPFMSREDIRSGTIWFNEIGTRLRACRVAILCVTRANQERPWLQFEAGAVGMALRANSFDVSKAGAEVTRQVIPYLIDLGDAELRQPLAAYQARSATRDDTLKLLQDVNELLDLPVDDDILVERFEDRWPTFDAELDRARIVAAAEPAPSASRGPDDKLDEMLNVIRRVDRSLQLDPTATVRLRRAAINDVPGGIVGREWIDAVRPSLRGLARALFAPVEVVAHRDGIVIMSAPNPSHQAKCAEHVAGVERAWLEAAGRTVTIEWGTEDPF